CGSSTVIFNGTADVNLNDSAPGGTIFNNVNFTSGHNATIQSGTFGISGTGVMTLSNSGTNVVAGTNNFIFKSDATGSATLATLPSGCQLTGNNITVQRYIPGGSSSERGYRLLSPSTFTTTNSHSNHIYSIGYLLNSTYISGTAFPATGTNPNSKTGNPSLYLYRENVSALNTTFLNGNYRGIASIASDPYYLINLDSDGTGAQYDIPVGNGYLFFFRGGSGTTNPFSTSSIPANGTLASTGTLNEGNVSVTNWYNESLGNTGLLYTTASGDLSIEGTNLVGNPYPATIDWSKFSNTNSAAGIYGPGLSGAIWMLVPGAQAGAGNYATYIPGVGATNGGTNLIASGEGFFVQATGAGATLTFTENAKTSTQATGAAVFMANKQSLSTTVKQQIRLQMQLDSVSADEILINFSPSTKAGYNMMEDARYRAGNGKVNLASLSSDNVALAINQLPLATKGDTIPLKVGATASGTYTLNLKSAQGIPQMYNIWLKDAFTKDSVNLRNTSSYSFTVNTADTTTFGAHRFVLALQQDPALAYKLISFDAEKSADGRQVQVSWKTQNEANNTNFAVERSNDNGKTYNVIGGMLSSGEGTYALADRNPGKGNNQYRLKQEDLNGNITYSSVVNIEFADNGNNSANRVTCYPNPAISNITLSFVPKSQSNATYDITISNSSGKVVKLVHTTDTKWQGNVSNLLTGTYLVKIFNSKDQSEVGTTKLIKL
ncbi:MAG: T9SS type A sorting domain-containing protein, partial [Mucilaginibacter sp.]